MGGECGCAQEAAADVQLSRQQRPPRPRLGAICYHHHRRSATLVTRAHGGRGGRERVTSAASPPPMGPSPPPVLRGAAAPAREPPRTRCRRRRRTRAAAPPVVLARGTGGAHVWTPPRPPAGGPLIPYRAARNAARAAGARTAARAAGACGHHVRSALGGGACGTGGGTPLGLSSAQVWKPPPQRWDGWPRPLGGSRAPPPTGGFVCGARARRAPGGRRHAPTRLGRRGEYRGGEGAPCRPPMSRRPMSPPAVTDGARAGAAPADPHPATGTARYHRRCACAPAGRRGASGNQRVPA